MKLALPKVLAKTDIPEELNNDTTWDDNFSAGASSGGVGVSF